MSTEQTILRRTYVQGEFGQLHCRIAEPAAPDAPRAVPLMCLHQSPKSGLEFEPFMRAAAADRQVIALDYPGYGMSDRPPSQDKADIAAYARAGWAVADALGVERLDVFGNHTGSKVAAEMAVQRPERVRAIAMVSAALLNDEEYERFTDFYQPIPLDRAGARFKTMWERIVQNAGPGMTLEMMATSMLQNMMGGEAYEWGHHAAFTWREPFRNALATLDQPITILNPADDLEECTRRAGPLMRRGEIVELPDWGHGFLSVHAREAADLVRSALDAAR